MNKNIYDIKEDSVSIEGKPWNDPTLQQLAWKNIYITQKMIDYWQPFLDRGETLFNMYDGKIIDDTRRAIYEDIEDKIVIEPPIMKAAIRALLGHAIQSRKSGAIGVEEGDLEDSPDNADEIETIDICLKHLEKKTKEQVKIRDAVHDAMVSCYPNVLLYQKRKPTGDNPLKYGLVHPAWNSCVFGPINTREPDLSDVTELVYMHQYTMGQLAEMYPDQKENLREHWGHKKLDDTQLASIMEWDDNFTAVDLGYITSIYNAAYGNLYAPGGLMPTFMRLFPIKSKQEVYVNVAPDEEDDDESMHVVLPEKWSQKRKDEWVQANKDKYDGPYERPTTTLWQCVFTATGLMLSSKKHWYQNYGKLPATIFVPCLINGKPSGPAVDMAPETLRNCVARIEYLDDMRKGSGELMVVKSGAFSKDSMENLASEANKSLGVVVLDKDFQGDLNNAYKIERRQPSVAWRDYGEYEKQEMSEITRINETMQGEAAPRQSNIAKSTEISQALIVSAIYFDNFNQQWENHQNLKLTMIPHNYDESMMEVEAYFEKEDATKKTTLNIPQYDNEGETVNYVNDVTSHRYRWMVSPVDDSPSAKSRYMQDALMIINGSAGPLMQSDQSGKLLASFWSALDNPILKEAGKRLGADMEERAKSQAQSEQATADAQSKAEMMKAEATLEKAKKAGVNLSFTGENFAQYPNLLSLYQQLINAQPPMSQPQVPQGEPTLPQGMPPAPPVSGVSDMQAAPADLAVPQPQQ